MKSLRYVTSLLKYAMNDIASREIKGDPPNLLLRHVDSRDVALLPHHLAQHVDVPAAARTQVQNPDPFQALRDHQATTVVPTEGTWTGSSNRPK